LITDRSERGIVEQDFETREEAEARRAELIAADPSLGGVLHVEESQRATAFELNRRAASSIHGSVACSGEGRQTTPRPHQHRI
jgi:hypothetical protein